MLQIEGIKVSYGNIVALHDISLTVNEGEIVTLIGANGAGKTTILKAISGLLRVQAGSISFCDRSISSSSPSEIVKLGISHCPEGRGIWPKMSVKEHLELGAFLRRDTEGIASDLEQVYEYFPILKERGQQLAGSMSGGQQQMLAVGRALMARPRLLLLDEPSLGLAPNLVLRVAEIVKLIRGNGTAVLLVEQNALLGLTISDRAYVIEKGKGILSGRSADLLNDVKVKEAYLGKR